ncbi:hypothetical protein CRUP_035093 [Coryphaenoides rupestris]|nr:hypothetical protein CRUP_035093 [Coryphaenoides rupestris]
MLINESKFHQQNRKVDSAYLVVHPSDDLTDEFEDRRGDEGRDTDSCVNTLFYLTVYGKDLCPYLSPVSGRLGGDDVTLTVLILDAARLHGERNGRTRVHWRGVQRCRNIPLTRCDLTNHTWDLEHGYYARVRAVGPRGSSDWTVTWPRFEPKSDSK